MENNTINVTLTKEEIYNIINALGTARFFEKEVNNDEEAKKIEMLRDKIAKSLFKV